MACGNGLPGGRAALGLAAQGEAHGVESRQLTRSSDAGAAAGGGAGEEQSDDDVDDASDKAAAV